MLYNGVRTEENVGEVAGVTTFIASAPVVAGSRHQSPANERMQA